MTKFHHEFSDGALWFDEEGALSALIGKDVLFCNERYYSNTEHGKSEGKTTVLYVNINDIMVPAADALDLTLEELPKLWGRYEKEEHWGVAKWAAVKCNQQPWSRFKKRMQEAGVWDDEMEKLPPATI